MQIKGRPSAVTRAVSLSHRTMGSDQPLRIFKKKARLGLSLSQTPLRPCSVISMPHGLGGIGKIYEEV
jgi:hypothetical protein